MPLQSIADRLEKGFVVGALSGDSAVSGIIGLSKSTAIKTRHIGSIWGMYVRPTARGSGLSGELLAAIIEEGRKSLRSLRLCVVTSNEAAIKLYKSAGFEEWALEIEALKVGETYYDELLMRLEIGAS